MTSSTGKPQYIARRALTLLLAVVIILSAFGGCNRKDPADDVTLTWPEGMSPSQAESPGEDDPDEPDKGFVPHSAPQSFATQIAEFKSKNADAVGWLYLPDTTINEVVVQDETGNEKYHRADATGKYDFNGCLYADYESRIAGNADQISPNIVIYGHSMTDTPESAKDEKKFTPLKKLLDKDFAEKHPYIYFSSETQDYVYEIFAAMYCNSDKFNYIDCNFELTSQADLVNTAKEGSIFNYPVEVDEDDKIISLSTCTYKFGDEKNTKQRFVVFGRLLSKSDEMPETVTLTENPAPKMPTF